MTKISDLFADLVLVVADPDGYNLADFFEISPDAEFATESEAVQALRGSYLGADQDGVSVDFDGLPVALDARALSACLTGAGAEDVSADAQFAALLIGGIA